MIKSVSKSTGITIDQELVDRCDRLRLDGRLKHWSLKRFREMIFEMGMDRFVLMFPQPRKSIEERTTLTQPETRRQAAGCETTPNAQPRSIGKIIPFPGVSPDTGSGIQDILDDFLQEMGYIE